MNMNRRTMQALLITALILPGFLRFEVGAADAPNAKADEPSKRQAGVTEAINRFGVSLYRTVAIQNESANLLISPCSISMALGMALNGAAGKTADELRKATEFQGLTDAQINEGFSKIASIFQSQIKQVKIANSIWLHKGFPAQPAFIDVGKKVFFTEVRTVDFAQDSTRDLVNKWVKEATMNKISAIIDQPFNPNLRMFLLNATYFHDRWAVPFDKNKTAISLFRDDRDGKKQVKMMHGDNLSLYHIKQNGFEAVRFPYQGGTVAMTIILLPKQVKGKRELDALVKWMAQEKKYSPGIGKVTIPRLTFDFYVRLNPALEALGVKTAFAPGADFSRLTPAKDLYLEYADHKAYIDVNEEGTEAAAATSLGGVLDEDEAPKPFTFVANRPFYILIEEVRTGLLLFIGRVVDPQSL